jgi:hypothetical protein
MVRAQTSGRLAAHLLRPSAFPLFGLSFSRRAAGGANPSEPPNPLTLRKQACIDNGDDAFRRGPPALGRIVLAVWIMAF